MTSFTSSGHIHFQIEKEKWTEQKRNQYTEQQHDEQSCNRILEMHGFMNCDWSLQELVNALYGGTTPGIFCIWVNGGCFVSNCSDSFDYFPSLYKFPVFTIELVSDRDNETRYLSFHQDSNPDKPLEEAIKALNAVMEMKDDFYKEIHLTHDKTAKLYRRRNVSHDCPLDNMFFHGAFANNTKRTLVLHKMKFKNATIKALVSALHSESRISFDRCSFPPNSNDVFTDLEKGSIAELSFCRCYMPTGFLQKFDIDVLRLQNYELVRLYDDTPLVGSVRCLSLDNCQHTSYYVKEQISQMITDAGLSHLRIENWSVSQAEFCEALVQLGLTKLKKLDLRKISYSYGDFRLPEKRKRDHDVIADEGDAINRTQLLALLFPGNETLESIQFDATTCHLETYREKIKHFADRNACRAHVGDFLECPVVSDGALGQALVRVCNSKDPETLHRVIVGKQHQIAGALRLKVRTK